MNIVEISKDSFIANRKFYDDKNYPRGMSRSGDFTLAEVQLIEQYGVALQEISAGKREPQTEDEIHFKSVCDGEQPPNNSIEKAWMKYQDKVLSPKQFHTLFGRSKVEMDANDVDSEPVDLDID